MSQTSVEKVKQIFAEYDSSGCGSISVLDFMAVLKIIANGSLPEEEIESSLATAIGKQEDGTLKVDEVLNWMFRDAGSGSPKLLGDNLQEKIEEWKTDDELKGLASVLAPELSDISLNFVSPDQFTDAGLGHIGAGLPPGLSKLDLRFLFSWTECGISSAGLGKFAAALPRGLTDLGLVFANDELDDQALEELANGLPAGLKTMKLGFKGNDVFTDNGLAKLMSGMLPGLKEVTLNFDSNTSLTDASLERLAEWLSGAGAGVTKLCVIDSHNENFTDAGFKKLCSALPKDLTELELNFNSSGISLELQKKFAQGTDKRISFLGA
ncbi:unnamed protein product [Polarella glacialis]|uniref:EF-hand domain-containing protein n=1 Tax=Polarella glacialis TaxID=89957 RepID=A0A813D5Y5_POLGL|nr:unnamed protein product [Polarella glacialis]CAE8737410.1 unnamed protein product [Polarella glacialis]